MKYQLRNLCVIIARLLLDLAMRRLDHDLEVFKNLLLMCSALREMQEIHFSLFFQLSNPKNFSTMYKANIDFRRGREKGRLDGKFEVHVITWGYVLQFSFCSIHLRLGAKDVSPQETMAVTNSKFLSKGLFLAKEIRSEQPKRTEKLSDSNCFLIAKHHKHFFF